MYTIDASVWVNSFDHRESGFQVSRQFLTIMSTRKIPIIVPSLVLPEVAGAISRTRSAAAEAEAFAIALSNLPNVTLAPLDTNLARQALSLAARHGLRGADAVYAAVALQAGTTLITLDNEQLNRLAGVVPTQTPVAAVAALASPGAA